MRPPSCDTPIALFSLLTLLAAGCGGDSGTGPGGNNGNGGGNGGNTDPVETTAVTVQDNLFSPGRNKVVPGATVTWTWTGGDLHNVTWVGVNLPNSLLQGAGTHAVVMPQAPGEYAYYCTQHGAPGSGMRGTVIVQ